MEDFIFKLAYDFNTYSELVALNNLQVKEGKCDEATLQWNRGHRDCIEGYLKHLAPVMGAELLWECKEHISSHGVCLEYRTAHLRFGICGEVR